VFEDSRDLFVIAPLRLEYKLM